MNKFIYVLSSILVLSGCGGDKNTIKLMDCNWTEQKIMCQIFKQYVEDNTTYKVDYIDCNGGLSIPIESLKKGIVDVIPSHSGSQLTLVLKDDYTDAVKGRVTEYCIENAYKKYGIKYIRLYYMNNYVALLQRSVKEKLGVNTVSEFVQYAGDYVGCACTDMYNRENTINWKNFLNCYGLKFKSDKGLDWNLMYEALGKGEVGLIIGEATSGFNKKFDLEVIDDDKLFFPPYEGLFCYKSLPDEVVKLFDNFEITVKDMTDMMYEYTVNQRVPKDIVNEWLKSKGYIK